MNSPTLLSAALVFALAAGALAAEPPQLRKWTSADGRTLEATFQSAAGGKVTIVRKDGRRFTLPLDKISEEDQAYVAGQIKMAEEAAAAAAEAKVEPASGIYADAVKNEWVKLKDHDIDFQFFGPKRVKEKLPLVIYLHGRNNDVLTPAEAPCGREFAKEDNFKERPCYLFVPQCPDSDKGWNGEIKDNVFAIIEDMQKNLPVDKDRIYLIGYSMGAYGTFRFLADEPKLFAAAVPIAGGGSPSSAKEFKKVPTWIFHGEKDPTVPVEQSRQMHEALEDANGEVKYTEMPGEDHGIAHKVWTMPEVHEWMFKQRRGEKMAE